MKNILTMVMAMGLLAGVAGASPSGSSFRVALNANVANTCTLTNGGPINVGFVQDNDGDGNPIFASSYSADSQLTGLANLRVNCNKGVAITPAYESEFQLFSDSEEDYLDITASASPETVSGGGQYSPYTHLIVMNYTIPAGQWGASAGNYSALQTITFNF